MINEDIEELCGIILGVGHMGQYHVSVAITLKNKITLAGIYDIDSEKAKEISNKYEIKCFESVEKFFENIDAVVIAVPTYLHYKFASLAMDYNLHILVEKPVTEKIEQARKLANKAKKKGLVFQVGHVSCFSILLEDHKVLHIFPESREGSDVALGFIFVSSSPLPGHSSVETLDYGQVGFFIFEELYVLSRTR